MGNTRREFTPEYKDQAIKLVINTDRPIAQVARELGVKEQTLGPSSAATARIVPPRSSRRKNASRSLALYCPFVLPLGLTTIASPHAQGVAMIAGIQAWEGWPYWATVIDAHSRRVIGLSIDDNIRTDLVEDALQMAITLRGELPEKVVFGSGIQYAPAQITEFAAANGIIRSMGLTALCGYKAIAESSSSALKNGRVNRAVHATKSRARRDVTAGIEPFRSRLRHSAPCQ